MPINPDSLDVVQVVKQESAALGGSAEDEAPYNTPIEPEEDGVEAAAVFLVEPGERNKEVALWRDGDDFRLRDVSNPGTSGEGFTLSDLLTGGGGLTEGQHKTLRQLIHFIEDGPAEGFTSGAYRETTGTVFPTAIVWWESSSKSKKIVERLITWSGVTATVDKWKVYDTDGTTVLWTVSDAISYSGVFEINRTRTITSGDA